MTDPTIAGQVSGDHDIVDGLRFLYDHGVPIAPAYGLQAAKEIERLRAAITAWADAWDAADRGEERDDGLGVYKYAERQEMALRKAVGR